MKVVLGAFRPYPRFAALGSIALATLACGGGVSRRGGADGGSGGSEQTGGSANPSAGTAAGGADMIAGPSKGGPKLRLLTQSEYKNALTDLLGTISTPLDLPADTSLAGFISIGASEVAVNGSAVALYETASLTAAAEVFADAARWQKLVGCQPPADLSDDCVVTFIQSFGKRAYRRDLDEAEIQQWAQVGREAAQLSASATQGLAAVTSGLLQSFNFLYRVETNNLDRSIGRLKYDGPSMATRLAFLLTGHPPSDALLAAAAAGELYTADGVRTAAAPLLNDPSAVERMAGFFSELSQAQLVSVVQKSPDLFPSFNAALQGSMLQATQLFIKNIVLAPGADVRSFFDSDQTFVDATLAPIYGVTPPASGFMQLKLGPEAARAGILGQAAVLAGHAQPERNSPTRRGIFILQNFLCQTPPVAPSGVVTTVPVDGGSNLTTRQRLAQHLADPSCVACHELIDPLGFALEHFDSIGQYRATEGGLTIDATGTLDGVAFDGEAQLATVLRQSPRALTCMMSNFYRDANGRIDAKADSAQIDTLGQTLTSKGYVWRDLVAEFVTSDAFRSAPVAPVTAGDQ
jgi:Protein of unknown function (DUF1588)/Protein of unknown function (DUF1592)/Protein of unknown function (DUF1595)/Protein of unknown function (DUF1585)/Protein of unknown function (DUF1587)